MKQIEREILKIAEREGVKDAYIIRNSPHGRLHGVLHNTPICLVISLTQIRNSRFPQVVKTDIRQAARKILNHGDYR